MNKYPSEGIVTEEILFREVPLRVAGAATIYAGALAVGERRLPIKPDYIWAEVVGGVMLTLLPLALAARRLPNVNSDVYERAVWRCFIAAGVPIILWQLLEQLLRRKSRRV